MPGRGRDLALASSAATTLPKRRIPARIWNDVVCLANAAPHRFPHHWSARSVDRGSLLDLLPAPLFDLRDNCKSLSVYQETWLLASSLSDCHRSDPGRG